VEAHNEVVQREFAAQAASFGDPRYVFADTEILDWILEHVPAEPHFTALDVAAGAGHLARAVAARVRQVVALDLTPEMLVAGKRAAEAAGVANTLFERGDAAALPYLDESFDLVTSRFAVHHFADPAVQLAEMVRVCRPGGHVVVIDLVAVDDAVAKRHNELERLRDPSHANALTEAKLAASLEQAGAAVERRTARDQTLSFDRWIAQARTPADIAADIRAELLAEIEGGTPTGIRPHMRGDRLLFTQRWAIVVAGT
jgi:ubiquinone/menaquinone biosynthesis C-methylase UbiE